MKVLHVITGLGTGGAEAILCRLVCSNIENDHVVISLTSLGKYGSILRNQGITVIPLNSQKGPGLVLLIFKISILLARHRPDLIQTWMYHADLIGGLIGFLFQYPVVWGIRHSFLDPSTTKFSTLIVARLCAFLSKKIPKRIIACAEKARSEHIKLGYCAKKIYVVPNGVDVSKFKPMPLDRYSLRQSWHIPQAIPVIGMVARWDPQKDFNNFFSALRLLDKNNFTFTAVMIGKDINAGNDELVKLLQSHNISQRVLLLGERDDVPQVMNTFDVLALSSLTEGFPNVLAECMACGIPCVSTDVGDASLIVAKTGKIVAKNNAHVLASALSQLLTELRCKSSWSIRKARCIQHISDYYSLNQMISGFKKTWFQAIS